MQYEEVVKMIKEREARVDEVLKAAKLERHEKQPMTKEMLAKILNYIVGTLAMLLGFGLLFWIVWLMGH